MNLEEYRRKINPVNNEIHELIREMVKNLKELANRNSESLKELIVDSNFHFYGLDGSFLETKKLSVQLFSYGNEKIYFNSSDQTFVFYNYDSSIHLELPQKISDHLLLTIFEDAKLYKAAEHVLGLSGILELSVKERSDILAALPTGNNVTQEG